MQQIYRRTLTPKCDFNKVEITLLWLKSSRYEFILMYDFLFIVLTFQNTKTFRILVSLESHGRVESSEGKYFGKKKN